MSETERVRATPGARRTRLANSASQATCNKSTAKTKDNAHAGNTQQQRSLAPSDQPHKQEDDAKHVRQQCNPKKKYHRPSRLPIRPVFIYAVPTRTNSNVCACINTLPCSRAVAAIVIKDMWVC